MKLNIIGKLKSSLNKRLRSYRELSFVFKGNVGVMALSWLLYGISGGISGYYFNIFFKDLGGTDVMLANARALALMVGSLMIVVGGFLTDVFGRVRIIIVGTTLVTVVTFLYAFARDANDLFILIIVDNAVHFYAPALTAIIMDSMPRDKAYSGFLLIQVIPSLPGLFAPLIGGRLYDIYGTKGVRLGYIISGFISSFIVFLRIKLLRETLRTVNRDLSFNVLKEIVLYKDRFVEAVKIYVYTGFIGPLVTAVSGVYGAIYLVEYLGLSKTYLGLLSTLGTTVSILSSIVIAPWVRKSIEKSAVISISLISFSQVSIALPIYVGYRDVFVPLSTIVSSIGGVMLGPVIQVMLMNTIPPEIRGRAIGLQRMFENASGALITKIAGILYTNLGAPVSFMLSPLFGLVAILYLLNVAKG